MNEGWAGLFCRANDFSNSLNSNFEGFKMKHAFFKSSVVAAALSAVVGTALALVTFDPETGTGFVGKGDVQLIYGWNNKQLQDNAGSLDFQSVGVTELSWECTNSNNEKIQPRARTTTTEGLVNHIDRVKNQITGFILEGYDGDPTTSTEGPLLNSCPSGPWSLTGPAGGAVPVSSKVEVSINGTDWFVVYNQAY